MVCSSGVKAVSSSSKYCSDRLSTPSAQTQASWKLGNVKVKQIAVY